MNQVRLIASPSLGNARFLTLFVLNMVVNERVDLTTGSEEHVMDILAGVCQVTVHGPGGYAQTFGRVGGRNDIFSGKPEFVYIPRDYTYTVRCLQTPFEAIIYTAPTEKTGVPMHVEHNQVKVLVSGASDWQRDVYIGLGGDGPATVMMVGETHSPPGNWSGFPPHRHSVDRPPTEAQMEELYYFKFWPPSGFAIGGIYEDIADRAGTARLFLVGDGQVFDVPSGYHFIAPCPGYKLHYTWALAGPHPRFGAWVADPDHAWLANYKPYQSKLSSLGRILYAD